MSGRIEQFLQFLCIADGSRTREVLTHIRSGSPSLSGHGGKGWEVRGEEGGWSIGRVNNEHSVGQVERVDHFQEGLRVFVVFLPGNNDLH